MKNHSDLLPWNYFLISLNMELLPILLIVPVIKEHECDNNNNYNNKVHSEKKYIQQ